MEKQKRKQRKGKFANKKLPPSAVLTEDCFAMPANKQYIESCENKKEIQP